TSAHPAVSPRCGRGSNPACRMPHGSSFLEWKPWSDAIAGHRQFAARSDAAAGYQLAGDDVALDFVGAFADDHQRGVAKIAFDVVFGGVAVAAVDPYRVERDLHRDLGSEQLGHPGLHVTALAAFVTLSGV